MVIVFRPIVLASILFVLTVGCENTGQESGDTPQFGPSTGPFANRTPEYALKDSYGSYSDKTTEQALIDQGTPFVEGEEIKLLVQGNTLVGDGWAIYFAADGRKAVSTGSGITEREWWVAEGQFCETLFKTGEEFCGVRYYQLDEGNYRVFSKSGRAFDFIVESGNVEDL